MIWIKALVLIKIDIDLNWSRLMISIDRHWWSASIDIWWSASTSIHDQHFSARMTNIDKHRSVLMIRIEQHYRSAVIDTDWHWYKGLWQRCTGPSWQSLQTFWMCPIFIETWLWDLSFIGMIRNDHDDIYDIYKILLTF